MYLSDLLSGTGISCPDGQEELNITGIACDSRKVKPGDLFVCIEGYQTDGHIYANDAVFRGAVAVLAQKESKVAGVPVLMAKDSRKALSRISAAFYGDPTREITVFGITGTNGKTTISYMIHQVVEAAGKVCGILGTIAYRYGGKTYDAPNTTPESNELHRMFRDMADQKVNQCVMEVSSHSLSLSRADDIHFDYAVFTNLTPDHMDFHENFDDYFTAKKKLFELTQKASAVNVDDPYGKELYQELKDRKAKVAGYSLKNKKADFYAVIDHTSETGSTLSVSHHGKPMGTLSINIPGVFSCYNALATLAIMTQAGYDFQTIQKGLGELRGVPGRFELVENSKHYVVIVDYAHTPDALEKILKTASEFTKGRLICVFGCGGDRDARKRPLMGKVVGEFADYAIITSDNPRNEKPADINAAIEAGIYETGCNYEIIENRTDAIRRAIQMYQKGDTIMIAGKGHETYQIIGATKTHFDDREVVREVINAI